jgi:outer membrane protein assembly factor BamD (BamD/ComL family)
MAGKIFINYRRGDDPGFAQALLGRLEQSFSSDQLFIDVDNIAPGLDFVHVLNERVAESDVLLAIIGKGWIQARDPEGARRLDDPNDFVRIEIESALNQNKRVIPVLVGEAQMPRPEELPETLRPLARRNAVRLTHERFRADTQGLVKALQQTLEEIGAQRQAQAEADSRTRVEEERRRQEAEAARRAEEERQRLEAETARRTEAAEQARKAEELARQAAAEERRRLEAAAKERAAAERAFAAAQKSNSLAAVEGFLSAYPGSPLAVEAQNLKAALRTRAEAFALAIAADDPAVLKAFSASYQRGGDVDQVRARLRLLEPRRSGSPAMLVSGALAVLLLGAVVVWFELSPSRSTQQVTATASRPRAPAERTAPSTQPETKPRAADSVPTVAPPVPQPGPDEVAWGLLKETSDDAALRRFIAQYPASPLRKDAEARVAAFTAAAAAKPVPPSPEEIAWKLVKDSSDPDQLRRFVEQFPNGTDRPAAEERIALLTDMAAKAPPANPPDPHELARTLQLELQRVGCFIGSVNGEFDDATKAAWHKFLKFASVSLPDGVSPDAINAVRGINKRVCPLICPHGKHAEAEGCVANESPQPHSAKPDQAATPLVPNVGSHIPLAPGEKCPAGTTLRTSPYYNARGTNTYCN